MPVILGLGKTKSAFEQQQFDTNPAHLNFSIAAANAILGGGTSLTEADFRELSGAPSNSVIEMRHMTSWNPADIGDDRPAPGLYMYVKHQAFIDGYNKIGLCHDPAVGYFVYIKDIFYNDQAPAGMAAVGLARTVRFCVRMGTRGIALLAAGGRKWPNITDGNGLDTGKRWGGYYFWARCGFDMALEPQDLALLPEFAHPAHLSGCAQVSDVLQGSEGLDWWKMCGSGSFMTFHTSPPNSVPTLEAYLNVKGL